MESHNLPYSPEPQEQCCRCSRPLSETGAYYLDRARVCRICYHNNEPDRREPTRPWKKIKRAVSRACGLSGNVT